MVTRPWPEAFHGNGNNGQTLEGAYVDGLSVTMGSPRNHIWTFAAGLSKYISNSNNCPCALYHGYAAPPFVEEEYYCKSGSNGTYSNQRYLDDPLWDSQGCAVGSTFCNRSGPWLTTTLNHTVSNDIEVRMCFYHSNGNIGVDELEIYIN